MPMGHARSDLGSFGGVCVERLKVMFWLLCFLSRFLWLLGVAKGLLQERPLQLQHGDVHVKVGNPCPTLGQLLANRILYALLVREKQHEIAGQDFVHRVAQKLVNS